MIANPDGVRHAYGLCFVRAPWAYFTRLPLDQQWGDGWERVPYQQHAGPPYTDSPEQILTVAFDGPLYAPDLGYDGKERSANEINRGEMPWLRTQSFVELIITPPKAWRLICIKHRPRSHQSFP